MVGHLIKKVQISGVKFDKMYHGERSHVTYMYCFKKQISFMLANVYTKPQFYWCVVAHFFQTM